MSRHYVMVLLRKDHHARENFNHKDTMSKVKRKIQDDKDFLA